MLDTAKSKRLLVIIRHSPYGSSLARASLDVALSAAAFDQPVNLLFSGDGVLQLMSGQQTESVGVKNIERLLASLPMYDIERVYVDAEAAARYRLDLSATPLPAKSLDHTAIGELLDNHDHVLGF